jgi:hypothetical protein
MPRVRQRRARGQALVFVLVLITILSVIGLTLITRNADQIDSSSAKRRYDISVTCADGARQLLLSQFSAYGANPTSVVLNSVVNDKLYTTGHYNAFQLQTVSVATGGQARSVGVSDAVNRTTGVHLGGSLYRMTVVCSDSTSNNRQDEVEFLVRFGF